MLMYKKINMREALKKRGKLGKRKSIKIKSYSRSIRHGKKKTGDAVKKMIHERRKVVRNKARK